jgi:hypothetical protein
MRTPWEWYAERKRRREVTEIFNYIMEKLEEGVPLTEIVVFTLDRSVEWDKKRQCWTVEFETALDPGQKVKLSSGRGGAIENATIVECLPLEKDSELYIHLLEFPS